MGLLQSQTRNSKKLDSYSMLIVSKYLLSIQDFINIICVNSKFKETTEKLRYNPIPITSLKLFPKIQTQYLYGENDEKIQGIDNYELWYKVTYNQYLKLKENSIKCHHVIYKKENILQHGNKIPDCVDSLDKMTFSYNKIEFVQISNRITSVGDYCFDSCRGLKTIELCNGIKIIGNSCFSCCWSLTSIFIPQSIQSIGMGCCSFCKGIKTINILGSLTSIKCESFIGCGQLESITLPSTIKNIEIRSFSDCKSLKKIDLPEQLTYIGHRCFEKCSSLTTINLPSLLKYIGNWGFSECSNLESIVGLKEVKLGIDCFEGCYKLKVKPKNILIN
ncbi:hypothetical protein QTN25_010227 [Entamoeba marina]